MNILMVLEAPYPSDIRVQKEYKSLIKAGHQVYLLCIRKDNQPAEEEIDGLKVIRIHVGQNNYALAFWDVINSVNFYHPLFGRAIADIAKKERIDAVHIHDLPLAGTAIRVRKKQDFKVVVDLHENYPEALKVWHEWKKNPIARLKNKLFLNPEKWIRYEKKAVEESDHVICVVDEMKERIMKIHHVDDNKVSVVTNSEEKSFIEQPLIEDIYGTLKNKFIITYTGGIGPHRGVDTLIEGMADLKNYDDIVLVIAGFGSKSVMDHLNELIHRHDLSDKVKLLGYQPFSNFYSLMKFSSVNAIPHHSNGHTDNTIPHKLFQGMMSGTPLIVSSSSALKRIVDEIGSGLVFKAGDVKDYVDKIKTLYEDDNLRKTMAKNGLNATLEGAYNWETTSKTLVRVYEELQLK